MTTGSPPTGFPAAVSPHRALSDPRDQRESQTGPRVPPEWTRHSPQEDFKAAGREPRRGKQKSTETGRKYSRAKEAKRKERLRKKRHVRDDSPGQNRGRRGGGCLTAGTRLHLSPVRQKVCVSVSVLQPDKKFWTGRSPDNNSFELVLTGK